MFVSLIDHRTYQPIANIHDPEVVGLVAREMLRRRPDYPVDSAVWPLEVAKRDALRKLVQGQEGRGETVEEPEWTRRLIPNEEVSS